MIIRSLNPFLTTKRRVPKRKPLSSRKEYIRLLRPQVVEPVIYADMPLNKQDRLKRNSIDHSLRATRGLTPRLRAIRRRRRREFLRIKYHLQNRTKECTMCHTTRALSDFDYAKDPRNSDKRIRKSYCFICRKKMNQAYYQRRKK